MVLSLKLNFFRLEGPEDRHHLRHAAVHHEADHLSASIFWGPPSCLGPLQNIPTTQLIVVAWSTRLLFEVPFAAVSKG